VQGLKAVFGFGNYNVIAGGKRSQPADQGFVEQGHIAGRHEGMRMGGVEEARVDSSQSPFPRPKVRNKAQIKVQVIPRRIGHQEDFIKKLDKEVFGSVDKTLAIDLDEGLIFTHAEVLTPGEDDASDLHRRTKGFEWLLFFLLSLQLGFQRIDLILESLVLSLKRRDLQVQLGDLAV